MGNADDDDDDDESVSSCERDDDDEEDISLPAGQPTHLPVLETNGINECVRFC